MKSILRTRAHVLVSLLPAVVILVASGADAQLQPVFDHLKCYAITDPLKVKHTLDLTPEQTQFLPEPGCLLKSPAKFFCIDVQKTNVQPTPGGPPVQAQDARDYLCYIVHCPNVNQNKVLTVFDQFGQRDITIKPPKLLCAPAQKVGVPPKPTPTPCVPPNPTPTPTNPPCITGGCAPCGSCGNGECHLGGGGNGCGTIDNNPLCVDASSCVQAQCTSNVDCGAGSVCTVRNGATECCALCP
jgi:hypothetical protein